MGYFDIFKDKSSQKNYSGVGGKAVRGQAKKRSQLRKAAGPSDPTRTKRPVKRGRKLYKRKKKIKGIFDRLKRK